MGEDLKKQLDDIGKQLDVLVYAVNGNPLNSEDGGIVQDIKSLREGQSHIEARITPLERFHAKIITTYVVLISIGSVLGASVALLIAFLSFIKK